MCDDRERLIGYVYDECHADERRRIEEHLASCHECRHEVRGLRAVRQDLLAWDVPKHESVWRPIAPVAVPSPWRTVPAWAMAAAAGLVLMAGAAGGAATYALLPRGATETAQAAAPVAAAPVRVTAPDLSALEQRVLTLERANATIDERFQAVAMRTGTSDASRAAAATDELARRVNALSSRQDEFSRTLLNVATETVGIKRRQGAQQQENNMLVSLIQGPGASQGLGGGR